MQYGQIKRILIGQPISSFQSEHQLIPKWKALATLSSDALSSVAYATDATLAILVGFSAVAAGWSFPIAIGISILLAILTGSYWQTIESYPTGGGAFTVAKENIGVNAGLIAGTALLIDYVLTVSVSVASGIENIGAAFPSVMQHKILLGAIVIFLIMVLNLRGIKESSTIFAFPTYFFVFSVAALVGTGFWKILHQIPIAKSTVPSHTLAAVPLILILRAFGSGCSALTGVEAISNGVALFKHPASKNAKITLVWMSVLLGGMFLSISALTQLFGIIPTEDQTVISLLGKAIFSGESVFYYMVQVATALILFLAANTSYADFPRLASLLAKDRFLPRQLAIQGDRLVFSNGIIGLSISAFMILKVFGGETLHMLPLYAIGVFLSFTLSQTGMVIHHVRTKHQHWQLSLVMNAVGAMTTAIVLLDIAYTKFLHGAWVVVFAIPIFVVFFKSINAHYISVGKQLTLLGEKPWGRPQPMKHAVLIPVSGVHKGVLDAIRYAVSISDDVNAFYVEINPALTEAVRKDWEQWATGVPLIVVTSPFRSVIDPLIRYIDEQKVKSPGEVITVLIPEFITKRWWHRFMHNQTAILLKAVLMFRKRVVVTTVRYHLDD